MALVNSTTQSTQKKPRIRYRTVRAWFTGNCLYDIQPGNELGLFFESQSPCGPGTTRGHATMIW